MHGLFKEQCYGEYKTAFIKDQWVPVISTQNYFISSCILIWFCRSYHSISMEPCSDSCVWKYSPGNNPTGVSLAYPSFFWKINGHMESKN